jgi:hypothetical protein
MFFDIKVSKELLDTDYTDLRDKNGFYMVLKSVLIRNIRVIRVQSTYPSRLDPLQAIVSRYHRAESFSTRFWVG